MKAVLLAAGRGSRLNPITKKISKLMIEIAGKPFLEYVINDLKKCKIKQICIVVGYLGSQIEEYFKDGKKFDIEIVYEKQFENRGTSFALRYVKDFVQTDSFLLYLADTILTDTLSSYIQTMVNSTAEIEIISSRVPFTQISKMGSIIIDKQNYVKNIVEKSNKSNSNLVWAGIALFHSNMIFEFLESTPPSENGEFDITTTINKIIVNGKKVRNNTCQGFIDSGTPQGLLQALNFILQKYHFNCNDGFPNRNDLEIINPVHIGKNCNIGKNSKIGPFVSIADYVNIGENVSLHNSLILNGVTINSNQQFSNSLITKHGIIKC